MTRPPPALPRPENGEASRMERGTRVGGWGAWIGGLVLILLIAAGAVYVTAKKYKVKAMLEIHRVEGASNTKDALISDPLLEQIIRDLDLESEFGMRDGPELRSKLRGLVRVNHVTGTSLVELVVEDTDKYRAALLSEGIVKAYQASLREQIIVQNQRMLADLDGQLNAQKERLDRAKERMENSLTEFREEPTEGVDKEGRGVPEKLRTPGG